MSTRRYGALDGAALVVATVIGSGIFTVPALVAQLVPSAAGIVAVWLLGGVLALAGALAYAELATRFPRSGGEYVYLREAFGPLVGFLSGWTSFIAGFSGAIAACAAGIALYLARVVPGLGHTPIASAELGPLAVVLSPSTIVGVGVIVLFTAINATGASAGRVTTSAFALVLVVGIATLALLGVASPGIAPIASTSVGLAGAGAALVPVMFTYSGWNAATYISNEFRNPSRDVPRALAIGTATVTLLYLAVNWTLIANLGSGGLARSSAPVESASAHILGANGSLWVTVLVIAALCSSVSAMIVTGPRIYAAMASDGALPRFFASVRGTDRRPIGAMLVQSAWSCMLVLTGTFETLVTYTGFAVVAFAGATVLGLFVIRRRGGTEHPGIYRTWGYPVFPALFVALSVYMLIATFRFQPGASLAGLTLIAAGIPIHAWMSARRAPASVTA